MIRFGWAALAGLSLMSGACSNSAEVRYKVTVEVDDRGTARSGSSVMSFKLLKPTVALVSPYNAEFKGEAVAVDLGNRQVLFALLVQLGELDVEEARRQHHDAHEHDRVREHDAPGNAELQTPAHTCHWSCQSS